MHPQRVARLIQSRRATRSRSCRRQAQTVRTARLRALHRSLRLDWGSRCTTATPGSRRGSMEMATNEGREGVGHAPRNFPCTAPQCRTPPADCIAQTSIFGAACTALVRFDLKAPTDLAPKGRGRAFWRATVAAFDLDDRELALLGEACLCFDRIQQLRAIVTEQGPLATGSTGQRVVHPAVIEERLQRQLVGQLLARLDLPPEDASAAGGYSEGSLRGRRAARIRWNRKGGVG